MNQKEIGKKIKSIRESQGISREQLAEKLNLSSYSIRNYEQGQRGVNLKNLNKFADALGVPVSEILGTNVTTNDIGTKIISAQTISDVSHEELAKRTGIDEQQLRIIKSGQINPTTEELNKIATALNLPLSYFIKNLSVNIDDEVIQDEHDPIELQIKYGIYKEGMTREELYSLIDFYQNKVSILSKKEATATQKLEAIAEIIKDK